jgi:hypothetical protein
VPIEVRWAILARSGAMSVPAEVRWVVLVGSGVVSVPTKVRWVILVERLGRNNDGSGNKNIIEFGNSLV